jgi:DNA-binding NarL/FixJ family response regulator
MPPTYLDEGLKAAKVIGSELSATGVLVLSQYVDERYAVELLADGAEASATCSRTASPRSTASSRRSAVSGRADRCLIQTWWRTCSDGASATTRWRP